MFLTCLAAWERDRGDVRALSGRGRVTARMAMVVGRELGRTEGSVRPTGGLVWRYGEGALTVTARCLGERVAAAEVRVNMPDLGSLRVLNAGTGWDRDEYHGGLWEERVRDLYRRAHVARLERLAREAAGSGWVDGFWGPLWVCRSLLAEFRSDRRRRFAPLDDSAAFPDPAQAGVSAGFERV